MPIWERERTRLNIPVKHQAKETDVPRVEPFTKDGLLKRLVKFVSSDDQVRLV